MDRGAWQATVHGVAKCWTGMSNPHTNPNDFKSYTTPNPIKSGVNCQFVFLLFWITFLIFFCLFPISVFILLIHKNISRLWHSASKWFSCCLSVFKDLFSHCAVRQLVLSCISISLLFCSYPKAVLTNCMSFSSYMVS